jgi:Domain of unknown function (DUF4442)
MISASGDIMRSLRHPLKFRMYLLSRLPAAFFAGLRIAHIDDDRCEVNVPYKWFTKNPFRSTYFACLAMAGEMSTGALCLLYVHQREPRISMLVTKLESEFFKKATGRARFICEDGPLIREAVAEAIRTKESRSVRARSIGRDREGNIVAEFFVTWSFKAKEK